MLKSSSYLGMSYLNLWNEAGKMKWFIGYCIQVITDKLSEVEYIQRCEKGSNLKWKYPSKPDVYKVVPEQILECAVEGEWNILSNRNSEFILRNRDIIQKKFLEAF